jgi:N-acetylmuramoyl-L-alanine amidase
MTAGQHRFGTERGWFPNLRAACRRASTHAVAAVVFGLQLVTMMAAPVAAQLRQEPAVLGLRFGESGPRTRVVLDFDRAVAFTARARSDPERLVIDLNDVQWRAGAATGTPRGLARAHRFAAGTAGGARFEVDMARPFRIVGAILLPPSKDSAHYRLVVDMVADGTDGRVDAGPVSPAPGLPPVPVSRPTGFAALPTTSAPVASTPPAAARAVPRLPVVVLDPGHGGADPGAIGIDGAYEKDLVLEMAKELRELIERSGKYRVALTRDGDEFIQLRDRIAKGRELGGQIFISIHADSLRAGEQRGASIYTISEMASDTEAAQLASQENKADILAGADLSRHDAVVTSILINLAQRDTNNKSIAFADIMAEELAGVTALVRKHRRFAGFAVLKSPDVPSVLLELGYLSNPDDARNLAQPDYRAKLGQAIVRSLDRYFVVPRS